MRLKANSTFFIGRSAGSASDFYYQKGRFTIPAGQSVISGIIEDKGYGIRYDGVPQAREGRQLPPPSNFFVL
jgi:hypothetical protein